MKTVLKVLGVLVLVLILFAFGGVAWAKGKTADLLGRTVAVHTVDFPIPFPLDSAEVAALGLTPEQADSVALARAVERGEHLVQSRYVCVECHGQDFGGGVMVDDPMIGSLLGPNLTLGRGSRTLAYGPADWDRIVRHGVKPDGTPGAMPSEDFVRMSDQELSDVVAYLRSKPPVDAEVPPIALGPLGSVLLATGQIPISADVIGEHQAPHAALPPMAEASAEYGQHVGAVCSGCHKADLSGGKIPGGDPSWPTAANLTSHADGLADWTFDDFETALRQGRRPDGRELLPPMSMVVGYSSRMTDVEMEALWMYLRSVPARPTTK